MSNLHNIKESLEHALEKLKSNIDVHQNINCHLLPVRDVVNDERNNVTNNPTVDDDGLIVYCQYLAHQLNLAAEISSVLIERTVNIVRGGGPDDVVVFTKDKLKTIHNTTSNNPLTTQF